MPDLNQLLETLLRGLEAGEVTNLFLWLLLGILVFAIVCKWFGWLPRFTAYAPAFLTSLGIFGTFVGIVIGLVDFDPNQIDKSVRDLLEGLKTAFASSIAGLGSGLFFRFLTTTPLFPESEEGDEDTDIPQRILVALNKQTQLLEATQEAIAGDEGSSLTGQVRLLREEHRHAHEEFMDQLWRKFAEQMQLLEATQNAIAGTGESSLSRQVMLLREDHARAHEEFTDQLWQKFAAQMQLLEAIQNATADDEGSSLIKLVGLWRQEHKYAHQAFTNQLWQEFAKQMKLLEETQEAIAGGEESSLAGQVRLLREDHKGAHAEQMKLLEATQEAIAGEGESSLSGQVKSLGEAHKNAHEEFTAQLWRKLDEFAEIMSRSATEQVIEALKEVITDFNQNLTEQFGENFKELNDAVKNLVEWQENYRKQLEQLHKLYEKATARIEDIEQAIRGIQQQCALIPQSMSKLEPIIETANRQIAELKQHLTAFAKMRDKATDAIPEISRFSEEMHKAVTEIIQEMATELGKIAYQFAENYKEHIEDMDDVIKQARAFNQERGDNR